MVGNFLLLSSILISQVSTIDEKIDDISNIELEDNQRIFLNHESKCGLHPVWNNKTEFEFITDDNNRTFLHIIADRRESGYNCRIFSIEEIRGLIIINLSTGQEVERITWE